MKMITLLASLYFVLNAIANDGIPEFPLRGQGQFNWYFLNIYEAKLWAPKSQNLYSSPLVLELKYKRNFKGQDIVKQTLTELVHAGVENMEIEEIKKKISNIFPDIQKGDSITASYSPTEGITFFLNSTKVLGHLREIGLSKHFLDIWLGEKTSASSLRLKLLGSEL